MIRPIVTKQDHTEAIERMTALAAKPSRTDDERAELRALGVLVRAYEEPIRAEIAALAGLDDDPVDWIMHAMERMNLTRKDLEPFIGTRARVSEVLARKRGLSIEMIRRLHAGLHIPLEFLVRESKKPAKPKPAKRTAAKPRKRAA